MRSYLFIGGTNGGREIQVKDGMGSIILEQKRTGFQTSVGGPASTEIYRLRELKDAAGASHPVFVVDGGDAIELLLSSYRHG